MQPSDFNAFRPGTSFRRGRRLKILPGIPIILFCLIALKITNLSAQSSPLKFHSNPGFKSQIRQQDPWFGKDKFDHFLGSAFLTTFTYYSARENFGQAHATALNLAGGLTLSLGIGKEIRDQKTKKGMASFRDFVADVLGVGIGLFICHVSF
jgi:uncharacterized protein YfiM (DUF2279 family)